MLRPADETDFDERHRGRFVKSLGDGALAVFDGPSRAISSIIRDLVVCSGQALADRCEHELKGVPGPWRIFAVVDT